ncbi:MAG: hypothetical protein ABF802_09615 [Acetobacter orientalis]|uniref:hypothetical protein n=2 Tax=Acetobacter orientalis TaxID=146474 RepID=UPI0039ED9813
MGLILREFYSPVNPGQFITDEMIGRFSLDLRAKLADGPIAMRKEYLRAIVDRIEVDDREIRIFGRKDRLMNQLVSDRPKLNPKVPSFGREWCPRRDSNPRPQDSYHFGFHRHPAA